MIVINFKIYQETFGDQAIKFAQIIKKISDNTQVKIIPVVSALDAYRLHESTGLEIWLQNIDLPQSDQGTGWISYLQALSLGIKGSLINHSEHRLPRGTIQKILKNKTPGFKIICCAHSLGQISWIKKSQPDYILYEPPELIANPLESVATKKAKTIKNAAQLASPIPLIVGAGIKSKEDVVTSLKMGAIGVCLSSAFVKNQNPSELLTELIDGFDAII